MAFLTLFIFLFLLLLILIMVISRTPIEDFGEFQVRKLLEKYYKNICALVLNDVTLRLKDGSTTQIDHVLVSTKGIFVIETKHYSGWIFADATSKVWTQVIYNVKNTFQNPIRQNYRHVKAIQSILMHLNSRAIHNVVVFTGEAVFKTYIPDNVFYIEELISAIEKYPDDILSIDEVQSCAKYIESIRLAPTIKTDIEHQLYLKQKFSR